MKRHCHVCGKPLTCDCYYSDYGLVKLDGRGHTYIEFDACHDCLTKIVETVKGTFKNTHADNVDDLISRSALLKEIGDPGDGMVWPTKEGVIALIKNAPTVK